jgi:large subunit GTPase 1
MTSEEITRNENEAFLEWRRQIWTVEEGAKNLAITPFEKNVNVWRQLWRVIEKADLLL